MKPTKIFYEPEIEKFALGKQLMAQFPHCPWIKIENHNNIAQLREKENREFSAMKHYLIIGTRKTHKYVENKKISDFLVPYTSSGCSAACLYCYLVCNYNKCSYLRLFVNREQMMQKLIKTANSCGADLVFEIGSNSDLVLENTITKNLPWTIETFGRQEKGYLTLPTKFHMVGGLLGLDHRGRTIIRISVNPSEIIRQVELGTSRLENRLEAAENLFCAGYPVGLLIAPVIFLDGWETMYTELLDTIAEKLSLRLKERLRLEIIFMTYSYVHRKINEEAFPGAINLYQSEKMTGRGRGKYWYRAELRQAGEEFFRREIKKRFPKAEIVYIV